MSFDLELTRLAGIAIVVNVLARRARRRGGFAAPSDDEWQKELGLNLMPAVRLDRALLPSMFAQGSDVIVHVTSIRHVLALFRTSARQLSERKITPGLAIRHDSSP
ncbi:hypothetical protein LGM85_14430 [Burkholderia multivorans]|nr:hypothetical protein [Burkholderia multivorans]MCA8485131.1 hypothetical protein [Burkholderia multivorans]